MVKIRIKSELELLELYDIESLWELPLPSYHPNMDRYLGKTIEIDSLYDKILHHPEINNLIRYKGLQWHGDWWELAKEDKKFVVKVEKSRYAMKEYTPEDYSGFKEFFSEK